MTCIITGCLLRAGGQNVGGDLHRIGTAYIFNAIVDGRGNAAWCTDSTFAHYTREIDASPCREYFERRGVAVFDFTAELNEAARNYLNGGPA